MKIRGSLNRQAYGDAVLERLARSTHAAALKKEAQVLKAVHGTFAKAGAVVATAQQQRDDALDAVGAADDTLDQALQALANSLVGAGLGTRRNPFAAYSAYVPSKLTALAYATEEKEVRRLVGKLRKQQLPAAVTAAIKPVVAAADEVALGLQQLAAPQADYELAIQQRDALLLDWNKALGRLKRAAAVAYDEDRAGYRALFAAAGTKLVAPRQPRKKAPAPPDAPTPAQP